MSNNPFGLSKVKHVIAVSSCKGGVGKSTVAAGISRALFAKGFKVGLLDADLHGPSLPTLFNLSNVHVGVNEFKMAIPVESEGLKLMSFGFLLGDAPAVMRGPILANYIQQLLFKTEWGELDYLIIDMPPGTGDVQLTITQSVRLTGAVIVTTRQTLSLVDVSRGILMFEKVKVPILGVVDNMAYFICDSCEKKHYVFGDSHSLENRFGIKILVEIRLIPDLNLKEYMNKAADSLLAVLEERNKGDQRIPQVAFSQQSIQLKFPDGKTLNLDNRDVRLACQCAVCVNEMTGQKTLNPSKIRPDIAPVEITPLGNYAIGISWNDGHSSGIYPYNLLEHLVHSH
jgi:ATP-binding protein involved in chromosome partitioning